MTLEIPFNEDIYKRQTKLQLDLAWNTILKKHKTNLIVSIFFFLFGVLTIYGKGNVGYVFVLFSMYGFLEFYKINTAYKKKQKGISANCI